MRVVVIDADSLVWQACYFNRDTPDGLVSSIEMEMKNILQATAATHFIGFFSRGSKEDMRKRVDPAYKAKRPPKPDWFRDLSPIAFKVLVDKYNCYDVAELCPGYEADDAVASAVSSLRGNNAFCIVAGIDKDLQQIPGEHYNYVKNLTTTVSEVDAIYALASQLITGDSTDNVKGIPGRGPAAVNRIFDSYHRNSLSSGPIYLKEALNQYLIDTVFGSTPILDRLGEFVKNVTLLRLETNLFKDPLSPLLVLQHVDDTL